MDNHSFITSWKRINESLTRKIIGKINSLPTPAKIAIDLFPSGPLVMKYVDVHRYLILRHAEQHLKTGTTKRELRTALDAYNTSRCVEGAGI
jgi:hypothetical protein